MDATKLKELRRQTGMTQIAFAEYIGINYHSLRGYERGRPMRELLGKFIAYKVNELTELANQEERRLNNELRQSTTKRKLV